MRNTSILLLITSLFYTFFGFSAMASELYDGQKLSRIGTEQLIEAIKPGSIVLLGENHGVAKHRDQHMFILNELRARGLKVSVGLEFVNYTDQLLVDQYRGGQLSEPDFLKAIKWGGFDFGFYRGQLTFPLVEQGELSLGLNIPRTITSKISRQGLAGLTEDELKLMPPNFALGRDSYRARFMAAAGGHCKVPDNCYAAQCTWDDTMAWQAVNFIEKHPEQVLVVVVGEFHVQYGGGIKHRLLQRLPGAQVVTLSQIDATEMTAEEVQQALQPSQTEGPRADFIWVSP